MSIASPEWLWLLCGLPLLAILRVRSHMAGKKGAPGLVSERLRQRLIVGNNLWLRWVTFSIQILALALLVLALARPRWGFEEEETAVEGRNVIIAIDTSRSMLADDLQPNRLERAKLAAFDIVEALPEDRIGLIAFAGKAFLSAPLTVDHDAVKESIEQLDTEIIPRGGTNLVEPVRMALETFSKATAEESALIIFSDGEDLEGDAELTKARRDADEAGMIIVAVGVGTEKGSVIPDPDAGQGGLFITDEQGNPVRSRLNPAALQEISLDTQNGVYLNLGSNAAMTDVVTKTLLQVSASREEGEARRKPVERFTWPLGLAVLLLLVAFLLPDSMRFLESFRSSTPEEKPVTSMPSGRKRSNGVSVVVTVGWLAMGSFAYASTPTNEENPAYQALKGEEFEKAIETYEAEIELAKAGKARAWLNLGLGSAAYRLGDYQRAKIAFGEALREGSPKVNTKAHYNIGNALFREGQAMLDAAGYVWEKPEEDAPMERPAGMSQEVVNSLFAMDFTILDADNIQRILNMEEARYLLATDERFQKKVKEALGGLPSEKPKEDPNANIDTAPAIEQWLAAIEHYEAAIEIDHDNAQARKNIEVVKAYLEELEPEDEPEKEEEEKEDDQEEEDKEDDQEEEDKEDEKENEDNQDEKNDDQNNDENQDDQNQDPPSDDNQENKDQPKDDSQDKENPENQPEDNPQGDEPKPEGDSPEDKPEDPGKEPQNPDDKEGDKDEQEGNQDPQKQQPNNPEQGEGDPKDAEDKESEGQPQNQEPTPAENSPPKEGELEANPSQPQPQPQQAANANPADLRKNEETGFSPSSARQILRRLSDEDLEVRPLVPIGSTKSEKFKNW